MFSVCTAPKTISPLPQSTQAGAFETPPQTSAPMETPAPLTQNSSLEIHYIYVEQADSTLVLCDSETMLIDGGNVEDSDLIASYLKKENVSTLDYIVCTYAHEDHCGGCIKSRTPMSYVWLREIMPRYAIMSVSKDNS